MKAHWLFLLVVVLFAMNASAAPINLGTAANFALLAGSGITNDPTNAAGTTVKGDVGSSPTFAVTGFPPGVVVGTLYTAASAVVAQAKADLVTAYNAAASVAPTASLTGQDLGGMTLPPGVYFFSSTAGLTGTLTLDAQGDPNAQWIFQVGSSLTTGTSSNVVLINGASPCNVFWQIGISATIQTNNNFVGNIMALTSITLNGGTLNGRALARNGLVSIPISETVVSGVCVPSHPCVSITKAANRPAAAVGDTIIYTYTVCNCGTTPITVDSISDDKLGPLTSVFTTVNGGSTLAVGACTAFTQSHTVSGSDSNPLVNKVTVTAHDSSGSTSDVASASVDITPTSPTTCVNVVKVADHIVASVGDLVTYTITVCNCGTSTLTVDSVSDSLLGDLTATFTTANGGTSIAGGQCQDFNYTRTVLASDVSPLDNKVTVNAHNGATPVTATGNWAINIVPGPCMSVAKTANPAVASVGDTIVYTFTICNCGTPPLQVNQVTDTHFGDITVDFISANGGSNIIPTGACVSFTKSRPVLPSDPTPLTNLVEVNASVGQVTLIQAAEASVPIVLRFVTQAVPADSGGTNTEFLGYNGTGAEVISSGPGVFSIVPGLDWANFIAAAQAQVPYTIKNVVLVKETPPLNQCADVFPVKTIFQQGTRNIRLWWPVMYEVPGTTWTLTIIYGTPVLFDDDGPGPNPPAYVHTQTWTWQVDATIQSIKDLLALFHELPFGRDEVPLMSNEPLYPILQAKLDAAAVAVANLDLVTAGLILGDFEMEVMDACIGVSPSKPNPTGTGTGIAQTDENPACCRLLVDTEYVGRKLGVFLSSK